MAKHSTTIRREDNGTGMLFICPYIVLMTIFVILPVVYSLVMSFYDWGFYNESQFVGLDNYRLVIRDGSFGRSLLVALRFAAYVVPIKFILSLLIALLLHALRGRFGGFVKGAIYVPTIISGIVASLMFVFIFDYMGGLANAIVSCLGYRRIAWLTTPGYAMASIIFPTIWLGFGVSTLVILAGLNEIPTVYYEAAGLDGAGALRKLLSITLPSLKNVFTYVLVTSLIGTLQTLDIPMLMTGGGPLKSTMMPNLLIYEHFKTDLKMGYTVAASLMLFVLIAIGSIVVFRLVNSEKSME